MKKEDVSVIIRSRNEERWIGHCLQSILDEIYKPEIIVIDNNSTDNTLNIVKSFKQDPYLKSNTRSYTNIKMYNIKDYSPGKSLNFGVKKSKNSILLIMSAHCVLKKININDLKKNLKKYKSIFGNQIPIWNGKKISKRYIWSHFGANKTINMFSKLENRYFHHNAIAIYESSFLKKNKFDEHLTSKEDRYWANKIILKKHKILYDPNLIVDHHYTENGNTWKGIG